MTTGNRSEPGTRRWLRLAAPIAGAVVLLVILGMAAAGWYYSERFERDVLAVKRKPDQFPLRVLSLTDGEITLDVSGNPGGDWSQPGIYGLDWRTGYGQMTEITRLEAATVTRRFTLLTGEAPEAGDAARTDTFAFPQDPAVGLGLEFDDVVVTGPLGEMPAWQVEAPGSTWAVLVHGQGAKRTEMLRAVNVLHGLDVNCLVITYRNDIEAPADPDGRYHLGGEEWRDVEAAVAFAADRGAGAIVLVGHSMGGSAAMAFMERSELATRVAAVVLDSPLLDLHRTVAWRARDLAPAPFVRFGLWASAVRLGLDWSDYNYLADAARVRVPVLVFHGDGDDLVPVETSMALADQLPDLVTLVSRPGVRHVQSWNRDPAEYLREMTAFLASLPDRDP